MCTVSSHIMGCIRVRRLSAYTNTDNWTTVLVWSTIGQRFPSLPQLVSLNEHKMKSETTDRLTTKSNSCTHLHTYIAKYLPTCMDGAEQYDVHVPTAHKESNAKDSLRWPI